MYAKKIVSDSNKYKIRRAAAPEICARDHGSPIEGSSETLQTSQHYGIKGFSGRPNWVPLYREAEATRAAELNFLQSGKSSEKMQCFSSPASLYPHTTRAGKKLGIVFLHFSFYPPSNLQQVAEPVKQQVLNRT